eukprot:TRINITY_DN12438_c0_g1_i3.p1 TRINITY_DN12438_c0_g1~~TRINITY_DN12438_c0_g1_i3.p1  ORF type:complete len:503 (-),score=79.89 TRINITY_DN12438_c0_g1_i3:296-1768(-)
MYRLSAGADLSSRRAGMGNCHADRASQDGSPTSDTRSLALPLQDRVCLPDSGSSGGGASSSSMPYHGDQFGPPWGLEAADVDGDADGDGLKASFAVQQLGDGDMDHIGATENPLCQDLSEEPGHETLRGWPRQAEACHALHRSIDDMLQTPTQLPSVAAQPRPTATSSSEPGPLPRQPVRGLLNVVECFDLLYEEILGYALQHPRTLAALAAASRQLSSSMEAFSAPRNVGLGMMPIWAIMYHARWSAFYDYLRWQAPSSPEGQTCTADWRSLYLDTLNGRMECTLEVFDREKKVGFAMAAMPARVRYEPRLDAFVARYISASHVAPEVIPQKEADCGAALEPTSLHRLRGGSRPADETGASLAPTTLSSPSHAAETEDEYPYRVLEGTEGLAEGMPVELQWKMQVGSPFGWWSGTLEAIRRDADKGLAHGTIVFSHFPANSRWYRLHLTFGDAMVRPCAFGGQTGGVRAVNEEEARHWRRFFPRRPVMI